MLPCYMQYIRKWGGGLELHDREGGGGDSIHFARFSKETHNGLFILSIREP